MLSLVASAPAFVPPTGLVAPVMQPQTQIRMAEGPMYDAPLAPAGMGAEFINSDRAPLSSYVGASWEAGDEVYDPLDLCELWKVSANNPDAAFLREAELKHCRLAMLAFAGIIHTSAGFHIPGDIWAVDDWSAALSTVQAKNPAALGQIFAGIGIVEGYTSKGVFDMWFGKTTVRAPGALGFDPLGLMPKDKEGAAKMELSELKNGRAAMIAVAGIACNHYIPGSVPGCPFP